MTELVFTKNDAISAIRMTRENGIDWLYENYPKPHGRPRRSITGFLMFEGEAYPVKPLGRLANEIAGEPMDWNPDTAVFRAHFSRLGFQLINSPETEAEQAAERQKRLARVWERPGQAKFRRQVFDLFGARCLVTGCETLICLEAAHIVPVGFGGDDKATNGLPLRADLHRLFDAGAMTVNPLTWRVVMAQSVLDGYGEFNGLDLGEMISGIQETADLAKALNRRAQVIKWIDNQA